MSTPKFKPVAFVNSDILIKAFVENDKPSLNKLMKFSDDMNVENGEKFLITEYVINDVVNAAYRNGTKKNKLFDFMFPGKTVYFQTASVPGYIVKHAIYLLDESPDEIKLNLTEWSGLIMMMELGIDTIISDNTELDEVLHDPQFHSIFKEGIKRI